MTFIIRIVPKGTQKNMFRQNNLPARGRREKYNTHREKEQIMFDLIPFGRNERNLFGLLDNVERSFWDGSISNMAQFRCDVQDKGDSYLLQAELPGFNREDIGIDLDGTTLVITARHNSESEEKDKDGNYLRRERKFGSFSRSFDVSGVDTEHIGAAYKNGVLELTLPKQAARAPQARRIEIAGE